MKSSASEPDLKCSLAGTESFFSLKSEAQPQEVGGPERGTCFRLQEYEGVGVSLIEVFERVGKSANPVGKN